jgi:acetyltransferase-like isoleucine patch superfamily enzyme
MITTNYTKEELLYLGINSVGENVQVSRKCSMYGASRISFGNNVRIDDFCVLSAGSGGISIGNFVHIAVFTSLQGEGQIVLEDFVGLSSRVSIYSSNDDYFGTYLSNPTVPVQFTGVQSGPVTIGKHVLVGSGSVVLPNVKIGQGAVVGALSLIQESCEEFYIYKGNPAKKLLKRSKNLLEIEKQLMEYLKSNESTGS